MPGNTASDAGVRLTPRLRSLPLERDEHVEEHVEDAEHGGQRHHHHPHRDGRLQPPGAAAAPTIVSVVTMALCCCPPSKATSTTRPECDYGSRQSAAASVTMIFASEAPSTPKTRKREKWAALIAVAFGLQMGLLLHKKFSMCGFRRSQPPCVEGSVEARR
jgi:hypothetical protein